MDLDEKKQTKQPYSGGCNLMQILIKSIILPQRSGDYYSIYIIVLTWCLTVKQLWWYWASESDIGKNIDLIKSIKIPT